MCFPLFHYIPLILKARTPYGANQTKKTEDLFKAVFPQVTGHNIKQHYRTQK